MEKKGSVNTSSYFHYPKSIHSLNILEQNARGIGNLGYIPEKDGVVRKTPMMIKIEQTMWPSLELEMIRTALNQKKYYLTKLSKRYKEASLPNFEIINLNIEILFEIFNKGDSFLFNTTLFFVFFAKSKATRAIRVTSEVV